MKRSGVIRFLKKLHKWPAIIIAFIATIYAFSGIVMNHRNTFSGIDVSRKLMPRNYTYNNWNLAAVRGSLQMGNGNSLIYGNIGIWESPDDFQTFKDFNQGFPEGIDNRKIYSVVKHKNKLFAGTHMGLYSRDLSRGIWQKIMLPVKAERIADLTLKNDSLIVLTRHYLLISNDGTDFKLNQLPAPVDYERKTGLFNTLWELHSGELFGLVGKLVVDLLGLVTIFLSVTGLLHFFFPKIIKRRKKRKKNTGSLAPIKRKNLRWHNVVGYIFVLFLFINTLSGMHLRPPLLIAIANAKVGIIPFTHMDSPNPWFDKLRRVHWDDLHKRYIFSTSDGMYFAEETLSKPLIAAYYQPPVSIMGCNVFKELDHGNYLVGSFSGMFIWNPVTGGVFDYFTRQPYVAPTGMTKPIAANMVAGLVEGKRAVYWFDYNRGAIGLNGFEFSEMPNEIRSGSPMSLWNVSLELHTGRIFEFILGPFYILYVPLAGICILIVLISGFYIWWLAYRRKK